MTVNSVHISPGEVLIYASSSYVDEKYSRPIAFVKGDDRYGAIIEWKAHWIDFIGKELYARPTNDAEAREAMLTALQEVLATPGLQSGLQAMCAAAIAKATGRDVVDVIKGV